MLDLRTPIGMLFTLVGAMLAVYGLATSGSAVYQHSLGININLWWGLVLTVFGALMWTMACLDKGSEDPPA